MWVTYSHQIAGLPHSCPGLKILDIANNKLHSLRGVSNFACLEDVWANTNELVDIDSVLAELVLLPKLDTIYLNFNKWSHPLPKEEMEASSSAIANSIASESCVPVGWSLHYPIARGTVLTKAEYKAAVLARLPNLVQLDDSYLWDFDAFTLSCIRHPMCPDLWFLL